MARIYDTQRQPALIAADRLSFSIVLEEEWQLIIHDERSSARLMTVHPDVQFSITACLGTATSSRTFLTVVASSDLTMGL